MEGLYLDYDLNTAQRQKKQKRKRILESAISLFCEMGIEATKMEEIAVKANVGTATVYRYFLTKAELVIQSATLLWEKESRLYLKRLKQIDFDNAEGIKQVSILLHLFGELYHNNSLFLKFLQEFDLFVINNDITPERLKGYEETILSLKPYLTEALEKGMRDHTIELTATIEEIYFSITHTMLSLMQKLILQGEILDSDLKVNAYSQIKIMIQIIVKGLKRTELDESITVR